MEWSSKGYDGHVWVHNFQLWCLLLFSLSRTLALSLPSEILNVFELASSELLTHFIPQSSYFSSGSGLKEETQRKKRKKKHDNQDSSDRQDHTFSLSPSNIIHILELCLHHVHRLTPIQKNAFNQCSFSLYSRYVACVIDFALDADVVKQSIFVDGFLFPALHLHLKTIEVDSFYWENLNKLDVVQKVCSITCELPRTKSLQVLTGTHSHPFTHSLKSNFNKPDLIL